MEITKYNREQIDLIRDTVAKGSTDMELKLFLHQCSRTGLDPLAKQIHAIKRWDNTLQREAMVVQTGIDGLRLIADRTGKYAPGDITIDENGKDASATATVKKMVGDTWHDVKATAYYSEFVQTKRDGTVNSMWKKMPRLMLGKCAEALALRRAFPAEMSGIYTHEEMAHADSEPVEQSPSPIQIPATTSAPAKEDGKNRKASDAQLRLIHARIKRAESIDEEAIKHNFGLESWKDLSAAKVNDVLAFIDKEGGTTDERK